MDKNNRPTISLAQNPVAQLGFVGLLMVASFLIGSLYTKVQFLEKGGVAAAPAAGQPAAAAPASKYKSIEEAITALVKKVKLDEKKFNACLTGEERKSVVTADAEEGNKVGVTGTPAFFINGRLIPGAVPFEQFKTVIDEELAGKKDPAVTRVDVALGNAPTRGTVGAPVTIVEYSDFQCPFCERVYPTVQKILEDYKGKVVIGYKHYPLYAIHPRAEKMAQVAECANAQGKFWDMHDALFASQNDWSSL